MFISIFLFGVAIIAIGLYAIRTPESWWFKKIGDDSEPSDEYLSSVRFKGKLIIVFGLFIILLGTQHLFV